MSNAHRSPWLITGVALLARLAMMVGMSPDLLSLWKFWNSGVEMSWLANSLVATGQFASPFGVPSGPTAYIAPGYPLLLAGIFEVFGAFSPAASLAILFLQALFSALVCAVIFYIGKETFGETAGVIGAWIWAVYPRAVIIPGLFLWETTASILLLTLGFLLALTLAESDRSRDWLAFGLLWGISVLINPSLLLAYGPVLLGAWYLNPRRREIQVRCLPGAVIALAALMAPWIVRNYVTFHKFIPMRDNFGYELWMGNRPEATGFFKYRIHMARDPKVLEEYRTQGELTYFAGKQEVAVNFIRQHPGTFVWLCVKRFYAFWVGLEEYGEISWTTLPIILFGMFGMVLLLRHRPRGTLLYFLPLLIYPLPYYLTHPDLRFRHLLEPLLILLGSYGVVQLTGRLQPAEDKVYVPAEDAAESDLDELPVLK